VQATASSVRLSAHLLAVVCQMARSQGFSDLGASVRPALKSHYPLIPIAEYIRWQTADGLPFDPWLGVHVRAGGHLLHPCPRAMTVRGLRQQWTTWTGLDFPGEGNYTIPHSLVPVSVRGTTGEHIAPGLWVVDRLQ
jgi:hypothetical protein